MGQGKNSMSAQEKLQRAIQATIAAGYQLNSEAFEYLCQNCETNDPVNIMNLALERIQALQDKPMFIERAFLEALQQQPTLSIPEIKSPEPQIAETPNLTQQNMEPQTVETEFYPYAKDVTADFKILEDATGKLSSNGTLEEYLFYFQDRFKRLEHLFRQRIDVKGATSILEALKSPAKTKLKIICMLTEKRDSKNHTILSVEDLQGSATVLVPQKAPEEVKKKALMLLPDQVVCLAVIKTRTNLFMVEDIIFPEIGRKQQQRAQEQVYAVLTSDIHIGSTKFTKESFKRFILWLKGKYGTPEMREIASRVKYLLSSWRHR